MWGVWQKFQTQYWIERTFTAVHERKGSIVINVFMKKTEFNCDHCVQKFHQSLQFGNTYTNSSWVTQNTGLKLQITAVNENEKFNCDQCGKNFTRGCDFKVCIQIAHEKTLNSIVITVAKISPKLSWIRQNTGLKLQITAVHENEKIKFWSMWQKFC